MKEKKQKKNKKAETQSVEELKQIEKESGEQILPEQEKVFSISKKFSKLHNLPNPTNPPMGYEPNKGYDNVFPFVRLPFLHPEDSEDNISFGYGSAGYLDEKNKRHPLNAVYFGDNLQILRSLPSNCIDLIYIDPPFFSGRTYNQVWGDNNELRTFSDIWDGGMPTYLIWLSARLWEIKRVLKQTGSIYVHCDWHASHYIKTEMDKIFGYENFRNEIVWHYQTYQGQVKNYYPRKHDVILFYTKTNQWQFCLMKDDRVEETIDYHRWRQYLNENNEITGANYPKNDSRFMDGYLRRWIEQCGRNPKPEDVILKIEGLTVDSVWDIKAVDPKSKERIGYPTQKPWKLLERIIKVSSNKGDIVADFFCGGGTTPLVSQKLGRRFISSDISRVAVSVTLDRLVRNAEEMTGRKATTSKRKESIQGKLMTEQEVPDIYTYYHGIYPVEKFKTLSQDDFKTFILACFGASKNSVEGSVSGFKTQFEPIFVGPTDPDEALNIQSIKKFIQDIIANHVQENQRYTLTILAWKFNPAIREYKRQLEKTYFKKMKKKKVVLELNLVPIRGKKFRERIATNYSLSEEDKDRLLQFIESPIINDIVIKKKEKKLTYSFEAIAKSISQEGGLINCQWDFNHTEGNFSESEYALNREQIKGNGFKAVLIAEKTFEKPGKYTIACKVQDNYGGEQIKTKEIKVEE